MYEALTLSVGRPAHVDVRRVAYVLLFDLEIVMHNFLVDIGGLSAE